MTRIESGPAKTDALWQLARAVLFLGFAGYFLYDGALGYPHKNQAVAEAALQARPFDGKLKFAELGEKPTKGEFTDLFKAKASLAQLREKLGLPNFTADRDEYYVTRYGYGRVSPADLGGQWVKWPNGGKDKEEITAQFYWALVPVPIRMRLSTPCSRMRSSPGLISPSCSSCFSSFSFGGCWFVPAPPGCVWAMIASVPRRVTPASETPARRKSRRESSEPSRMLMLRVSLARRDNLNRQTVE